MNGEDYETLVENFLRNLNEEYEKRSKWVKEPEYSLGDIVTFKFDGNSKTGYVYVVDAYGTFEQDEEPSYDIMVENENCLYKHIRESGISKKEN